MQKNRGDLLEVFCAQQIVAFVIFIRLFLFR